MVINNPTPTHDYTATVISVLALTVALFTCYAQFFRKTYKLIYSRGSNVSPVRPRKPFQHDAVLCNTGNTDLLVTNVVFWIRNAKTNASSFGSYPNIEGNKLPILIKPGNIVLLNLQSDIDFLGKYMHCATEINEKHARFDIDLEFGLTLANGHIRNGRFPICWLTIDLPTLSANQRSQSEYAPHSFQNINILSNKYSKRLN